MADVTIDDVAKAAGVHRSTVSRALSRPEAVKVQTRELILRVAEELGYTMSPLAQALRSKTSIFVPLVVPDLTNPFYAELATTMTQAAGDRGYQLVLCITNGDNERTAGYLTAMQSLYAPFAIVAPSSRVDLDTLAQFGFGDRVVVIDRVDEHVDRAECHRRQPPRHRARLRSSALARPPPDRLRLGHLGHAHRPRALGRVPRHSPVTTPSSSTAEPTPKRASERPHSSSP